MIPWSRRTLAAGLAPVEGRSDLQRATGVAVWADSSAAERMRAFSRPGRSALWVDVDAVPPPAVAASSSRICGFAASETTAEFASYGPQGRRLVTWVRLPAKPRQVQATTHAGIPCPCDVDWYPDARLLRLTYPAHSAGVDFGIQW